VKLVIRSAAFALLLALAGPAPAGKFNKTLSVGDAAPTWENLAGTDGKTHSLADLKDKDVVVVVFTCNSCPVAEGYEDRIIAFAKAHAGPDAKVGLVAINVNTAKDDALPAMTQRAKKKKLPYPYLFDPSQEVARKYGANYTPEFFVLNKERKVVYQGAMDDKSNAAAVKVKYLEPAVSAALDGKPAATAETSAAAGCRIRFNKKEDE
jgi:peroxiredoxin